MAWNEETIARLRALWAEGLSVAEIGRRMAISKNAVVGKAHRLNLPPRPSPIKRGGQAKPKVPKRIKKGEQTLPQLPAAAIVAPPTPVHTATPEASQTVFRTLRPQACCWPIGDSRSKSFRYCDAEATPGKPYCGEHCAIAYVKVEDPRGAKKTGVPMMPEEVPKAPKPASLPATANPAAKNRPTVVPKTPPPPRVVAAPTPTSQHVAAAPPPPAPPPVPQATMQTVATPAAPPKQKPKRQKPIWGKGWGKDAAD